jgi:hypothetical protein
MFPRKTRAKTGNRQFNTIIYSTVERHGRHNSFRKDGNVILEKITVRMYLKFLFNIEGKKKSKAVASNIGHHLFELFVDEFFKNFYGVFLAAEPAAQIDPISFSRKAQKFTAIFAQQLFHFSMPSTIKQAYAVDPGAQMCIQKVSDNNK